MFLAFPSHFLQVSFNRFVYVAFLSTPYTKLRMRVNLLTKFKSHISDEGNSEDSVSNKTASRKNSLRAKLFSKRALKEQLSREKQSDGNASAKDSPPGAFTPTPQSKCKPDHSPDEVAEAAGLHATIVSLRAAIFTLDAIIIDTRNVLSTIIHSLKCLSPTYSHPTNAFIFAIPERIEEMCYVGATCARTGTNTKGTVPGTNVTIDSSMAGPVTMPGGERYKRLHLPPKAAASGELRNQIELLLLKEAELFKALAYFDHRAQLWTSVERDLKTFPSTHQISRIEHEIKGEEAQKHLRKDIALQAALLQTPFGRMAEGLLKLPEKEKQRRREEREFCVRGVTRVGGQKGFLAGAVGVASMEMVVSEEVVEGRDSGVDLETREESQEQGLAVHFLPRFRY